MGDCCRRNDFRFFTPLRCVRNDRMGMAAFGMTGKGCCAAFRMTREGTLRSGWQNLARVVSSEGRNLKLETGGCATILDSSLRCAAFRMTGEGRFVQDGRVNCCAAFGMTGKGCCAAFRMTREGTLRSGWQNLARVVSSEGRNLKLETGGCATILDSSLRCAAFRMTEWGWLRPE